MAALKKVVGAAGAAGAKVAVEVQKTYTITYGDVAENHARMQKIGKLHENGYSVGLLQRVHDKLVADGVTCEIIDLHDHWGGEDEVEDACVLIIRRGVQHLFAGAYEAADGTDGSTAALMAENDELDMDKHALMKGRVVNKHARWNLCFAEEDQEPDYESGKGRVIAWKHIPMMQRIREWIAEITEDTLLNGEANYYYDISKCGIGFHGDAERRKVFAVRMGATMPLHYQWFQRSTPVGDPVILELNDGDMYMMSEKAVGFDWLKKIQPTLRHAAGCKKFLKV